jgi:tight adherence protein C
MVTSLLLDIGLTLGVLCGISGVYLLSRTELRPDADAVLNASREYRWLNPARLLRHAGIMPADFKFVYWPLKLSLAVTMPLTIAELNPATPAWMLASSSLSGFISLDFLLWQRRKRRQQAVQGSLSFFVDLVSAYLQSGKSMASAFEQAGEFGFDRKHPLALEVQLVSREIRAGESYPKAFERLYLRTGVPELQRLAAVITVGRQAGAAMTDTLAQQAEAIRERQDELNRKLISQKSIKLLLAMMTVGLPVFSVIVIFPAVVKISEIFQLLKGIL